MPADRFTTGSNDPRTFQGGGGNAKANYRYWKKLKNLHEHYAHQISRQIIDYCKIQNASILVLPEYNKDYGNIILASVGKNSPLRLVPSIREKLKYKAWQEGIVVLEVQQHNINSVCSQCGAKIRRKGAGFPMRKRSSRQQISEYGTEPWTEMPG